MAVRSLAIAHPHQPDRDSIALVIIDVQERLVPAMHEFEPVAANLRRLIQGFGLLGLPVTATEQYPRGLGPTIPGLAELLPAPPPDKTAFSCFGCDAWRDAIGDVRDLVLAGIETHVCVLQTALDALADGRRVFIAGDAVTSRQPRCRDLALAQLAAAGAVVASTETLLFQLVGDAAAEPFRAISRLVR